MGISISGLSGSGLDVTSIIESLMDAERVPYTNLESKKSNLESQKAVFRQLNTSLISLQNAMSDLQYESNFKVNKGTLANTNVANVTTTASAVAGTYNLNVKQLAEFETRLSGSFDPNGEQLKNEGLVFTLPRPTTDDPNNAISINLNEKVDGEFKFKNNKEVLENLVKEINANSSTYKATAALVDVNGDGNLQLALTATEGKTESTVNFSLAGQSSSAVLVNGQPKLGKSAIIEVNGIEITRINNNFDNVINGVSITAKETGTTQLTVARDADAIVEKIESFVNKYNEVMTFINKNLAKAESDNLINPLQGDSTLKNLKDHLYDSLTKGLAYTGSNGKLGFLEEIGLKIGADSSGKYTGLIELDTSKLKASINSDAQKVEELFIGIMEPAYNLTREKFTNSSTGSLASKISGFDSQIKTVDDKLESMSRSLEMKQARLKTQFTAMETMLASLNSTSSWLETQLGNLASSGSSKK